MEVTNKEAIEMFENMKRGVFPYNAGPYCDAAIHALYISDLTSLSEDELVELRNKCNAQINRIRNTGKSFERKKPERRKYYYFLNKDEANEFYLKYREYKEWTFTENEYYVVVLYITSDIHKEIKELYALKNFRRYVQCTGTVENIMDNYICTKKD